jgi:hypothetical protein
MHNNLNLIISTLKDILSTTVIMHSLRKTFLFQEMGDAHQGMK